MTAHAGLRPTAMILISVSWADTGWAFGNDGHIYSNHGGTWIQKL